MSIFVSAGQGMVAELTQDVMHIRSIETCNQRFFLRGITFDHTYKELIIWLYPKREGYGEVFSIDENSFRELAEIVYTEQNNSITIKISEESELFVSDTGDGFTSYKGNDVTGSVAITVKMDPRKFTQWAKCHNGTLIFRLTNGQEYAFSAFNH